MAVLGFNVALVSAHGYGGGGLGGDHHSAHPHTHYHGGEHGHEGLQYDSHYHHDHDDYGNHYHPCRPTPGSNADSGTDNGEECLNHKGEWEPSLDD